MKILIAKGQKEDNKIKVITSAPVDRPDVRKKIINQYVTKNMKNKIQGYETKNDTAETYSKIEKGLLKELQQDFENDKFSEKLRDAQDIRNEQLID